MTPWRTETHVKPESYLRDVVRAVLASDHDAVEASADIVRETRSGNDAAVAVAFQTRDERLRRGFIGMVRNGTGAWRPAGGWSGGLDEASSDEVFVTYGGWGTGGSKGHSVFGGWVSDPTAVFARLVDPTTGDVLEDQVVNEVVIFMAESGLPPRYARVELLDADHMVLRSAPAQRRIQRGARPTPEERP